MRSKMTVPQIKGLIIDEKSDEFSVRDVDECLARFWRAILTFRGGKRAQFVKPVEIGSWESVGFTFVEVPAQANMTVGKSEE